MSNLIYNKDATEFFLEPKSVDLFLSHPPYFVSNKVHYGGDLTRQIQNNEYDEYLQLFVNSLKHMSYALKDNGNILIILKNNSSSFDIIAKIKETDLYINKTIIWDYRDSSFINDGRVINGDEFALIIILNKINQQSSNYEKLNNFIIQLPWNTDKEDLEKYNNLGFVYDCFPESLSSILIDNYSKPGDAVADIFGGTGTAAVSSIKLNRKYVYNDISIEQYNIAQKRISDTIDRLNKKETEMAGSFSEEEMGNLVVGQFKPTDPVLESNEEKEKRSKAIKLMVAAVEKENTDMAKAANQDLTQLEEWHKQQRPMMEAISDKIYNTLKDNGYIL